MLIEIGINNSLHAEDETNIEFIDGDIPATTQDFEAMFNILDNTVKAILPRATVRFAPLIATADPLWTGSKFCQDAYEEMNRLILMRNHVTLDSKMPVRERLIRGKDKVHMDDDDGIEFWTDVFKQLE